MNCVLSFSSISLFIIFVGTDGLLKCYKPYYIYHSINFSFYRTDNIYSIPGQQPQLCIYKTGERISRLYELETTQDSDIDFYQRPTTHQQKQQSSITLDLQTLFTG